ncbi:amidase [Limibaculum sp. M0105]|uniref:Amidase n=1 Tax=Thermohalobaculum xanthum TaxID=2753746 RepID=A0A8J7SHZ9_9RHOB|nr:amidase [Thermohalobaculum xanthum]MBK0401082.1 amidase [Thermohalobaculum xanthum]
MAEPWTLTATGIAVRIRAGTLRSEEAVLSCFHRIAARDGTVQAWEWLDLDGAIYEARARDAEPPRGPLHGVPVAVKDIIDTDDMPTGYGSTIYAGHRPQRDADCVERLRAAGAVILGKTVTTEFATYRPGKTRNPHDPGRTPGGSSSGSAAAVASGMAPLALGTQTVGSVIRPASFCGVVGFKTSKGRVPMTGVKPLAAALDSLGVFSRTVADAALWFTSVTGEAVPEQHGSAARVGLVRTAHWSEAEPETRAAVEQVAARLKSAGGEVGEPDLPPAFARLAEAQDIIFATGAVAALAQEWKEQRHTLSPQLCAVLERGEAVSEQELADARAVAESCHATMARLFGNYDLILAPAAKGEAPRGLETTGDPLFNRMWTLLLGPCATLPAASGPNGMPVGVQFIGAFRRDATFLGHLGWAAHVLGLDHGVEPV